MAVAALPAATPAGKSPKPMSSVSPSSSDVSSLAVTVTVFDVSEAANDTVAGAS